LLKLGYIGFKGLWNFYQFLTKIVNFNQNPWNFRGHHVVNILRRDTRRKEIMMRPEYVRLLGWYLVLAVVIAACSASGLFGGATFIDLRTVQQGTWVLQAYGSENALTPTVPGSRITLIFDFDAKAAKGSAGCNHYNTNFALKASNLSFSDAMRTLMACSPDEIMEQETTYLNLLGQVIGYQIEENTLILLTETGSVLHFQASK
jgi:heat shock protein HslJ